MEILIRPQLQGSLQTECHSSSCQQGRYLSTVEYPSNAVHSTSNGRIQPEDADGQCSPQRSPKVQPSLLPCYQHRIQGVIRILRRSDSTKGPTSTTPSSNVCLRSYDIGLQVPIVNIRLLEGESIANRCSFGFSYILSNEGGDNHMFRRVQVVDDGLCGDGRQYSEYK